VVALPEEGLAATDIFTKRLQIQRLLFSRVQANINDSDRGGTEYRILPLALRSPSRILA
jgi:hypothetical protein